MGDSFQRKVARGARLLDEEYPGWHKKVDSESLLMQDGNACILGQTFKDAVGTYDDDGYDAGRKALELSEDEKADFNVFAYGFDALDAGPYGSSRDAYDKLAFHWRGQIGKRLVNDGLRILRGLK